MRAPWRATIYEHGERCCRYAPRTVANRARTDETIRTTSFESALSRPAVLFADEKARDALTQFNASVTDAVRLARLGRVVRDGDAVRLIFSDETVRRLRSGELRIPIDRASGFPRAEARIARGEFARGHGSSRSATANASFEASLPPRTSSAPWTSKLGSRPSWTASSPSSLPTVSASCGVCTCPCRRRSASRTQ